MNYFDKVFSRERGTLGIVGEPGTGVNWIGHLYLRHLNFTPNLLFKSDIEEYIVPNFLNRSRFVINDDLTISPVDHIEYDSPLDVFHYRDVLRNNGWVNKKVNENGIKQIIMLDTSKISKDTQTRLYKLHYFKRRLSNLISIRHPGRDNPHFPLVLELFEERLDLDDRLLLFVANLFKNNRKNNHMPKEQLLSSSHEISVFKSEVSRFKEYNSFLLENFKYVSPLSDDGVLYFFLRNKLDVNEFKQFVKSRVGYNYITFWGRLDNDSQHEAVLKCQHEFLKCEIPFFKVDYNDLFFTHNDTGTPLDNYKKETAQYTRDNNKVIQLFDELFLL